MIELESCASTQDEIKERLERGEAPGAAKLWLRARRQTQGRGRPGRQWESSESRNLYVSCGFAWRLPAEQKPLLSLLSGVAMLETLQTLVPPVDTAPARIFLKWPNDVYVVDPNAGPELGKLGGILAEAFREFVVVGWGLNLYLPSLAEEVLAGGGSTRAVTSLQNLSGRDFEAAEVAEHLRNSFERWLREWEGDPRGTPRRFLEAAATGMETLWGRSGTTRGGQSATAVGLDTESGELLVRLSDGAHVSLSAGEFIFE